MTTTHGTDPRGVKLAGTVGLVAGALDPGPAGSALRRRRRVPQSGLLGVLGIVLFFAAWHAFVVLGDVADTTLPAPLDVADALSDHWSLLVDNMWYTLRTILIGFGLSALMGVGLAVLLRASKVLDGLVTPIIVGVQTVPKIALLPLILAWFGLGQLTGLVVVVLIATFPILINTRLGFSSIDEEYRSLGRVMGGSRTRIFASIEAPLALPAIFSGLEVGMTLAVTGAAAAEFFAGSEGVAFVMQTAASSLRMDVAFAALLALTALGIVLYYLTRFAAWGLMPWRRGRR